MKPFKISYFDKEKNPIGEQTVSMSVNNVDSHKISFVGKNNTVPFVIDIENHELILDNSNGEFDAITQDKPIAKIKVSNIRLDYEQNITFSLDDSQTSYRIAGNSFEQKQGSTYVPIKTYDSIFDIVLPSTLFADMDAGKININGFPFQMFEALTEQDKTDLGVETYQSSSKLLNIIKYKDQVYIARGKKFIPVSLENQNYYKIGDKSIFGLTIGRNNGISGKQSQGIAFKMPEAELEDVAKFLNGTLDTINFKSEDDLQTNDIDYRRINQQSDLEKIMMGITPTPTPDPTPNPNPNPPPEDEEEIDEDTHTTRSPQPPPQTPPQNPTPNTPPPPENKKPEPKKEDKPPKEPEKIEAGLGALFGALAFIMGAFLIAGIFFGPFAWFCFAAFSSVALFNFTAAGITSSSKKHKTKQEKIMGKISKKQKALDKLQNKTPSRSRNKKMQRIQNTIAKQQSKLNNLNPQNNVNTQTTSNAAVEVADENTRITPTVDESSIDSEMTNGANTNNQSSTTQHSLGEDKANIHSSLSTVLKNKPNTIEERATMVDAINSQVQTACPDGTNISSVAESDRPFYQSCIDFRTAYMAEQSAKASYEQAIAGGNPDEILITDAAYQQARDNLNIQLNNLYNASATQSTPTPTPTDTGRSA